MASTTDPEPIPRRLDRLEDALDKLPKDRGPRYRALIAVISELIQDWPRDAYPRLTRLQTRAARLWIELAARLPTRRR